MHRRVAGKLTGPVTKWFVLVAWLAVAVPGAYFGFQLSEVQNNEMSSWLPTSAESTRALEKLEPFQDPDAMPTAVVYEREGGLTSDDLRAISSQGREIAAMDGIEGPVLTPETVPPLASRDGEAAQVVATFNFGANGWEEMPAVADDLREVAQIDGVTVHIAGSGGQAADQAEAFSGLDTTLLGATLGVVVLILLLTYRSPVLWLLPILSAVVALFTAEGVVYFLAKYADMTVNGQTQGIMTVLVIGAGTDYALLLVARYREELRRHENRHEAMSFALHRAAPAILASAATVVVGMLCLLFADMNSTAGLGPANAVGVAITLLVMITLLPALLVICGRWVFWPRRPHFGSVEPTASGLWARVGRGIAPRPRAVWLVTAGILAVACLGMLRLDTSGLSTEGSYTKEFDAVAGQKVLEEHSLVDSSTPIMVVADAQEAGAVSQAIAQVEGVGAASEPTVQDGVAFIRVPVAADPLSQESFDAVERVRTAVHAVDGADALVGGMSASFLDIENASHRDNLVIIPIVLVVVLLILILLLRALVSPLLLIATVVLSFGAALGISALLFEYLFGFEATEAGFPLYVFVFLVALGIDYNIFLMTRVREETAQRGTRSGSLVALSATGGVITSAGLVLAATFAVLGTLPLVAFVEMGTAVALGVILDTMIVRSVLVTALNLDFGSRIWWPSRLDRHSTDPDPDPESEPERVNA
jgi:putative drug exporter of the RND superfamily